MANNNKKLSVQANMIYNTVGSVIYLGCQWLINITVVRFGSYDAAGMLALTMSVTNIFATVSTFGMRAFHVSDIDNKYSEALYVRTRLLTCLSAFALCVVFTLFNRYSIEQALCIIIYMLFKLTEGMADVFQGIQQKKSRMDYICFSFAMRGILSLGTFTLVLYLTENLVLAISAVAVSTALVVIIYDLLICKKLTDLSEKVRTKLCFNVLRECYPLMFNSMFTAGLISVPRYFLEQIDGRTLLGYYGSVATPTVIVQTACTFIYNPLISTFSESIKEKDKKRFKKTMLAVAGLFALLITGCLIGGKLLGEWGLKLLYGESILPYVYLFIPIMIVTILIAMIYFLSMLMTIIRKIRLMAIINGVALLADAVLAPLFIKRCSIDGINYALYIVLSFDIIMLILALCKNLKRIFND